MRVYEIYDATQAHRPGDQYPAGPLRADSRVYHPSRGMLIARAEHEPLTSSRSKIRCSILLRGVELAPGDRRRRGAIRDTLGRRWRVTAATLEAPASVRCDCEDFFLGLVARADRACRPVRPRARDLSAWLAAPDPQPGRPRWRLQTYFVPRPAAPGRGAAALRLPGRAPAAPADHRAADARGRGEAKRGCPSIPAALGVPTAKMPFGRGSSAGRRAKKRGCPGSDPGCPPAGPRPGSGGSAGQRGWLDKIRSGPQNPGCPSGPGYPRSPGRPAGHAKLVARVRCGCPGEVKMMARTEAGKQSDKKYRESGKGRAAQSAAQARYAKSKKGRQAIAAASRRYRARKKAAALETRLPSEG